MWNCEKDLNKEIKEMRIERNFLNKVLDTTKDCTERKKLNRKIELLEIEIKMCLEQ